MTLRIFILRTFFKGSDNFLRTIFNERDIKILEYWMTGSYNIFLSYYFVLNFII